MKPRTGNAPPCLYRILLAISVTGLCASRAPLCQRESIRLLHTFIEQAGNSSGGGTLYTPEDITVCYANNLGCFYMELQVLREQREEHAETLSRLSLRLGQLRRKLRRTGGASPCAACPPCHSHPEKPPLAFLRRLLELLQWNCRMGAQQRRASCPTPEPENGSLGTQTTPSAAPTSKSR